MPALLSLAVTPLVGDAAATVPAPEHPAFERSVKTRHAFGLNAAPDHVRALLATDPDLLDSFGAPMTAAEVAEITARQAVARADVPVVRALLGNHPAYGGVYLDNATGKLTVALTTGDGTATAARLREAVGSPERLSIRPARHSLATLKRAKETVLANRGTLAAQGIEVASVGPDESDNALLVGVTGDAAAAQPALDALVGSGVARVSGSSIHGLYGSAGIRDAYPYRGGQHIRNTSAVSQGYKGDCTLGFLGYRNTVPTTYFLLTAGHCGRQADTFGQPTYFAGHINPRSFNTSSPADAARLPVPAIQDGVDVRSRQIYVYSSGSSRYDTIGYRQSPMNDVEGQGVCQTGITTGYTCGTLQNRDLAYGFNDQWGVRGEFPHGRMTDTFDCDGGDSGGPIFFQGGAYGVLSAKEYVNWASDRCYYNHIFDVLKAVDVHGLWQVG